MKTKKTIRRRSAASKKTNRNIFMKVICKLSMRYPPTIEPMKVPTPAKMLIYDIQRGLCCFDTESYVKFVIPMVSAAFAKPETA